MRAICLLHAVFSDGVRSFFPISFFLALMENMQGLLRDNGFGISTARGLHGRVCQVVPGGDEPAFLFLPHSLERSPFYSLF